MLLVRYANAPFISIEKKNKLDGAIISFLLGGDEIAVKSNDSKAMPTMEDIIKTAFEQEVLALVS